MKKISIDALQVGSTLTWPVYIGPPYIKMLETGTILDENKITKLKEMQIDFVYIAEKEKKEDIPPHLPFPAISGFENCLTTRYCILMNCRQARPR